MRTADTVYTAQVDIDRLQARIFELPNDAHVELTLVDGRVLAGIVSGRPTIQQFFDRSGREGSNATVRLEQPALDAPERAGWIDLFLDQIVQVRALDRGELERTYLPHGHGPQNGAGAHPPSA
ncbi:DUF3247 family protein [Lysobacter humi (ex Lee et al. 2017)]